MFGRADLEHGRWRCLIREDLERPKRRIAPLNPRNLQQQRNTGETKDGEAKGNRMGIHATRVLWLAILTLALSAASFAQVAVVIRFGPPPLPVYEQPLCPAEGYIWTPGYWAYDYDFDDYYWVPGTWVLAPEPGLFWTPGHWAWDGDSFIFYEGYWGPRVGFYGGINYGYGYFGRGYDGGRWEDGRFFYNRSVNNVNITEIHNVYNTTVINNTTVTRVSYNGGNGGINARPTPEEEAAAHETHIPPVTVQTQQVQAARADPQLRASVNRGRPPIAATPRPGVFSDRAVVPAREAGGPYNPPANRGAGQPRGNPPVAPVENNVTRPRAAVHPKDLPPVELRPPNTGNPKLDQKYQQQEEKLHSKQDQERQKLQQKQEQDHQRLEKQTADEARRQQLEQKHQQQTERLQQKHGKDWRKLQDKQRPGPPNPPRPQEEKP
jgi:hypothetical protein